MLGERPIIPTRVGLTLIRILKRGRKAATVELVEGGISFELPLTLLPEGVAPGEELSLKILDSAGEEECHTRFAQKLLAEIIQ